MLEEMDTLFGGVNHVEKGGDILHIEDAHHANVGGSGGGNTNDEITQYPLPSASGTRNEGEESGIKETKLWLIS